MLTYREMKTEEAETISQIDATYYINKAWRINPATNEYELTEINWTDYELPNGFDWHRKRFIQTTTTGGKAFGCYDGALLVGYATINAGIFGTNEQYVLLDQLFVSKDYRNKGIGKELVALCKKAAVDFGAKKIFLCAGSSENTVAFYKKIGCVSATERNEELYLEDPRDIQMELDLFNLSIE